MQDTLIELIGETKLKSICTEIAESVRKHDLHREPEICARLFLYMTEVINGWNCV